MVKRFRSDRVNPASCLDLGLCLFFGFAQEAVEMIGKRLSMMFTKRNVSGDDEITSSEATDYFTIGSVRARRYRNKRM